MLLDLLHDALLGSVTASTGAVSENLWVSVVNLWLGVGAVLTVAMIVVCWRLLHPRPRICVSERGILDRNLGVGWIPWDSVEGAYFPRTVDFQGLLLRLRPSPRLLKLGQRRGTARQRGQTFEVRIDLRDSDWNPVDLLQEILSRTGPSTARVG